MSKFSYLDTKRFSTNNSRFMPMYSISAHKASAHKNAMQIGEELIVISIKLLDIWVYTIHD